MESVCYYFSAFSFTSSRFLKPVLCLLVFAPIPLFGVINSVLAGMEEEAVGFVSSISFLISLPLMTLVLILFGLA